MAATGDLRSLLGPATFNQIPSHAAGVLQELWTKTSDNLRLKEEKVRNTWSNSSLCHSGLLVKDVLSGCLDFHLCMFLGPR